MLDQAQTSIGPFNATVYSDAPSPSRPGFEASSVKRGLERIEAVRGITYCSYEAGATINGRTYRGLTAEVKRAESDWAKSIAVQGFYASFRTNNYGNELTEAASNKLRQTVGVELCRHAAAEFERLKHLAKLQFLTQVETEAESELCKWRETLAAAHNQQSALEKTRSTDEAA